MPKINLLATLNLCLGALFLSPTNLLAKPSRTSFVPIDNIFSQQGISRSCTNASYKKLRNYVFALLKKNSAQIEEAIRLNAKTGSLEDHKEYLELAFERLNQAQNLDCSHMHKFQAFDTARSLVYSVYTDTYPITPMALLDWLDLLENTVQTIPYLEPSQKQIPIGLAQANLEAYNLHNPRTDKVYSASELAKMSNEHLSVIDISPDHDMWQTEAQRLWDKKQGLDRWKEIEKDNNKRAQKKLKKKERNKNLQGKYDLKIAKNVLIFDKIKTTASSPKIKTKDLFGMEWKIKWGNEAFVEPVVNRLYLMLGGKYADLTYTSTPSKPQILILGAPKKKGSCTGNIESVKRFNYCMFHSLYKFDARPYIHQYGLVSEKNYQRVFAHVLPLVKDPKELKKYIGRTWIMFKESMVEFNYSNTLNKGGPGPENVLGFENDRVRRGIGLFEAFIGSVDAKEDNSRSVLVKDKKTKKSHYLRYIHDMGSSLGTTLWPGSINDIRTNTDFIYTATSIFRQAPDLLLKLSFIGKEWIVIPHIHLYKPTAWSVSTYADNLWMAKKIATLSDEEIALAVSQSNIPSFAQEALISKLANRRNQIIKRFRLEESVVSFDSYPLTIKYDLSSKKLREQAARQLNLPKDMLESFVLKNKLLKDGQPLWDTVVLKDNVVSCEHSILVNLLEKHWFPAGLGRRISRIAYSSPLPTCTYKGAK